MTYPGLRHELWPPTIATATISLSPLAAEDSPHGRIDADISGGRDGLRYSNALTSRSVQRRRNPADRPLSRVAPRHGAHAHHGRALHQDEQVRRSLLLGGRPR